MRDLYIAFGLLLAGFFTLELRATRAPYDFREELLADSRDQNSLTSALEKALVKQHEQNAPSAQPRPAK